MSIFNHSRKKTFLPRQGPDRHLVIIAGYYGFDNLGDESILEELLNELNSLYDRAAIVVLSHNPEKTASLYQVKSVNRWDWFTCMNLFKNAKLLISGGGGLFQDRTSFASVIFYSAQIFLARLCGAKVLIYAQGLGPLQRILSRNIARTAIKQADQITVRDYNSLAMVKAWGLDCQLTADPVWSLSPSALPAQASEMLETIKDKLAKFPDAKGMLIGLSLRNDPMLQNYHLQILAKSIAEAAPAKSVILLLPLQTEKDREPLKKTEQFLLESGVSTVWLDPAILVRPSQWLALMENFDLVVGMRFHAILMALKASKPVIGISYDQKVSQILIDFNQPSLSLDLDKYTCESAWAQTIKTAIATRADSSNVMKDKLNIAKKMADRNINVLAKILEVDTASNVTSIHG